MLQKEVAIAAGLHPANYNKMEKGELEMTIDQIIHYEGEVPQDVTIEDKSVNERMKLIEQLEEEDRKAVFRIIDGMLTKAKFKEFFQKNMDTL